MTFVKGDIVRAPMNKRHPDKLRHPAIVWDDIAEKGSDFLGIMLTHSEPKGRYHNILMSEKHFEPDHELTYSKTHFVNQLFMKFQEWGPFYKCGRLTDSGMEFIESNLTQIVPITFNEYK